MPFPPLARGWPLHTPSVVLLTAERDPRARQLVATSCAKWAFIGSRCSDEFGSVCRHADAPLTRGMDHRQACSTPTHTPSCIPTTHGAVPPTFAGPCSPRAPWLARFVPVMLVRHHTCVPLHVCGCAACVPRGHYSATVVLIFRHHAAASPSCRPCVGVWLRYKEVDSG